MIEHKIFSAEVKEYDEKDLTVTHFISTERKDRGSDIMRADGMRIRGRVVVLMAHGRSQYGQEPIAKPVWIKKGEFKGNKGIMAKTQFFPDEDGQRLFAKATTGFMPNWSIGYIILKKEDFKDGDGYGRDVKEWELLEYSPVGVPMNPDAQATEKVTDQISFKVFNSNFFETLKGQRITVVDEKGKPLSLEQIKKIAEDEARAWFWSAMSEK